LSRTASESKIQSMNAWRKCIVCLLLVTLPVSLWAAVVVPEHPPGDCGMSVATEGLASASKAHVGHDMGVSGSLAMDHGPDHQTPTRDEPCCDTTCASACLATGVSALNLQAAALEPVVHDMHYKLDRATHLLAGPSYPSLYRPPISQS